MKAGVLQLIQSTACITFLVFCISVDVFAQTVLAPKFETPLVQGSLVFGTIPVGAQLKLSNQNIKTNSSGQFVFGLGRDHPEILELSIIKKNKSETYRYHVLQRKYKTQSIKGVAQKYVTPPKERLDRIADENRQVKAARQTFTEKNYFLEQAIMPAKGRISGVYGSQRIFNGTPKRPHYGLDIAAPTGTPVIAPLAGTVSLSHDNMYYSGGTLIIDHGMGVSSTFIHLDKIHVKKGDTIEQGQHIANIGATGRVTGPHLDWRINWFNTRLDPALLFTHLPSEIK